MKLDITSVGRISATLNVPMSEVVATARKLQITESRINGVLHFDTADLDRIDRHIRQSNKKEN